MSMEIKIKINKMSKADAFIKRSKNAKIFFFKQKKKKTVNK